MSINTIVRRKVILPLLLLATVIAMAAGAAQGAGQPPPNGLRDTPTLMAEVNRGRARLVDTPASRIRHTTGVWTGCHFVYLTTKITDYETNAGEFVSVSSDPDPMPPTNCVERRNPTEGEMTAMRAVVAARNAAARPPGPPGSEKVPEWVPDGAFNGTPG
ncbi:MAG: hypothetical protein LC808_14715 [Actinobacteria bacterium]|nr:hypothetical protein [Actinomycetota bacterium]